MAKSRNFNGFKDATDEDIKYVVQTVAKEVNKYPEVFKGRSGYISARSIVIDEFNKRGIRWDKGDTLYKSMDGLSKKTKVVTNYEKPKTTSRPINRDSRKLV